MDVGRFKPAMVPQGEERKSYVGAEAFCLTLRRRHRRSRGAAYDAVFPSRAIFFLWQPCCRTFRGLGNLVPGKDSNKAARASFVTIIYILFIPTSLYQKSSPHAFLPSRPGANMCAIMALTPLSSLFHRAYNTFPLRYHLIVGSSQLRRATKAGDLDHC